MSEALEAKRCYWCTICATSYDQNDKSVCRGADFLGIFQRMLAMAILSVRPSVCLFVCLSVTRVDQSKTVQARITKSSPLAAWKTLVS